MKQDDPQKKLKGIPLSLPKKDGKTKKEKDFFAQVKGKLCYSFDFGEFATKLVVAKVTRGRTDVKSIVLIENGEHNTQIDETNLKEWRTRIQRELSKHGLNPSGQIGLCTIGSRHYISRRLEVNMASEEDRQGFIAYEMSQSLSLDAEAYVFQHKVLSTYEQNGVKMCSVLAVAVPRALCENYYRLLEALRLKPLAMDININGMERILMADRQFAAKTRKDTVALIDYGMRTTEINIYENGENVQSTRIESGDGRLVSAAKNALGVQIADIHNGNKLVAPPLVVYEIMNQKGSETAEIFINVVEKWLTDINATLRRYNIDHQANPISTVYLYGGSTQFPWLRAYLEKFSEIPTKVITGISCCEIPQKIKLEDNTVPQFLNAFGGVVRPEGAAGFNFFKILQKNGKVSSGPSAIGMIKGLVALVLCCILVYGVFAFKGHQLNSQLLYLDGLKNDPLLTEKYNATIEVSKLVKASGKEKEFMELLVQYAEDASAANIDLIHVLDDCVFEKCTLEKLSVSAQNIELSGYSESLENLIAAERSFRSCGHFQTVLVQTVTGEELPEEDETEEEAKAPEEAAEPQTSENGEEAPEEEKTPEPIQFTCKLVLNGGAIHEEQ